MNTIKKIILVGIFSVMSTGTFVLNCFDRGLLRGAVLGGASYLVGSGLRTAFGDKKGTSFLFGAALSTVAASRGSEHLGRGRYLLVAAAIYQVQRALYQLNSVKKITHNRIPLREMLLTTYGFGLGKAVARSRENQKFWFWVELAPWIYGVVSSWQLPVDASAKSFYKNAVNEETYTLGCVPPQLQACGVTESFFQRTLYTTKKERLQDDGQKEVVITLFGIDGQNAEYEIADFRFDVGNCTLDSSIIFDNDCGHLWIFMGPKNEHIGSLSHMVLKKNDSGRYQVELEEKFFAREQKTFGPLLKIDFDKLSKEKILFGQRSVKFSIK